MADRNPPGNRTPTKILISLAFFCITFVATWLFEVLGTQPMVLVGFGASLFVAGVAFVVQFLYDVEKRLDTMEEELERHSRVNEARIDEGFQKINAATKLFGLVEASALKTDAITQLVGNSVRIKPNPQLVFDLAQTEIQRLSEMLKTLGDSGDLTYDGEDRDWLLGLTKHVNHSLDAISTTLDVGGQDYFDGSLWQSDLGQRYLEAQRDAVRRNVRVRRIFILDRPELREDINFRRVVGMHDDIKIEVRALDPTLFPRQFIPPIFDFIIFDGSVSYQTSPSAPVTEPSRATIASTQLITNQSKVQRNIDRFNDLWKIATPII
ncbi:phosphatidylserine/phosphatidylglycerophosphate/cardiolipin synthase family protein [Catellatospora sichuanensis]|uniref:phosphatidylserine/phosphatidylglycerophosphate/ cardiolipin synthase family protein n=1 Tax=Catellatospora sichuanensis TaxID=1969805 RepID=UPI001182DC86|nr:phosphatidylserine/phosphatidylglycerophosphate/cardiolipin synthase family protein [Catellatospora sichuanensis]